MDATENRLDLTDVDNVRALTALEMWERVACTCGFELPYDVVKLWMRRGWASYRTLESGGKEWSSTPGGRAALKELWARLELQVGFAKGDSDG